MARLVVTSKPLLSLFIEDTRGRTLGHKDRLVKRCPLRGKCFLISSWAANGPFIRMFQGKVNGEEIGYQLGRATLYHRWSVGH